MELRYNNNRDFTADWQRLVNYWKAKEPGRFKQTYEGFSMKFREFTAYFVKEYTNTIRLSFGSIRNIDDTSSLTDMYGMAVDFTTAKWR